MIYSVSISSGTLLSMLSLRIHTHKTSSVTPLHVAVNNNEMADIVSRAFKKGRYFFTFNNIITYFNHHLPLPQNESWIKYKIFIKWLSQVIACLCGKQFPMAWLQRLPNIVKNTGIICVTAPIFAKSMLSSPTSISPSNAMSSLHHFLLSPCQACTEKTQQSKFKGSRTLLRPSPRPSNWL